MADTYSKLLINESPLSVLPSLVSAIGLEKAIILQQIQYLLHQKKSGKILADGEKYIWNTAKEFAEEHFTFWKPDTIRKHLRELENKGFLICQQPNLGQGVATKFYRIGYEKLNEVVAEKEVTHSEFDAAPIRSLMPHHSEFDAASDSEFDAGSLKGTKTTTKTTAKNIEHAETTNTQKPSNDPVQTASKTFEMLLPINSQEAIESAEISNLELWETILTEAKAGMSDGQWQNDNYKQRAIGFALSSYRTAFARKSNNFKSQQPQIKNQVGYDTTKDMLSPDYVAPKKRMTFDEIIMISYDIGSTAPTTDNYNRTKTDYLTSAGNTDTAKAEIENYERSDEFRKIFSQMEQAESRGSFAGSGRTEYPKAANQMPVPR